MANFNKVILVGNLTRDPELRYIPSGQAVTTLGVAVNTTFAPKDGEKREETCFINVVVWGRQAETCSEYLSKGRPVLVEGRLRSRSWEAQDGTKRSTIEVVAQRVQFLGSRGAGQSSAGKGDSQVPAGETDDGNQEQKQGDDDIPF